LILHYLFVAVFLKMQPLAQFLLFYNKINKLNGFYDFDSLIALA